MMPTSQSKDPAVNDAHKDSPPRLATPLPEEGWYRLPPDLGQPLLYIVSAPSGAGKTSLCRRVSSLVNWITYSISYTTRDPRPGEVDGVDYFFVSPQVFVEMKERGDFLETAEVYGNHYGTARSQIESSFAKGKDVLVDIDIQGARTMRASDIPSISVYILPPSYAVLRQRLSARAQDSEATIKKRLDRAKNEIISYNEYDYLLINREFDRTAQDLLAIIRAEHYRKAGLKAYMEEVFLREFSEERQVNSSDIQNRMPETDNRH